ncbi:DUF3566 domain-containing protein [Nocardioides currus]|uniref:DUF3566 domain-containing protein n=1 Tax=Nocardioides currus TaxID=2133958 RepID=A0A2R7YZ54_9ACTN|nr:DUF3566 domain-containing protein [Nocardioides currus]PUA81169.1 hypothetical protein C7S10_09000 [Nocardioides currus]
MSERIAPRASGGTSSSDASTPADSETTQRAPLAERITSTLSNAATEHRANAVAGTADEPRKQARGAAKSPRRARLRLTRIDPWSVMKTSFLLSVAFGVVTFVAVFMVWSVLGAAGVWDSINSTVASVVEGDSNTSDFDVTNYLGMGRVLGFTLLVSIMDVILLTAIATLTAFLYNMAAALLGGIEVTLAEDER